MGAHAASDYRLLVQGDIQGLLGSAWAGTVDEAIERPTLTETRQEYGIAATTGAVSPKGAPQEVRQKSPFVLGLYPGYPCPLEPTSLDLAGGQAGRCLGGIQPHTVPAGFEDVAVPVDDIIPLPQMPANRPIVVVTSEPLDEDTIILGKTFTVHEVDADGVLQGTVEGRLDINGDTLQFSPEEDWKEGAYYSYSLKSNGDFGSSVADCDPASPDTMLCSTEGLPLHTQLLSKPAITYDKNDARKGAGFYNGPYNTATWIEAATGRQFPNETPVWNGGGQDLTQYFVGAAATETVLQMLRLTENLDANKNLLLENDLQDQGPFPFPGNSRIGDSLLWNYAQQEATGLTWQADSNTQGLTDPHGLPLDPGGVQPQPNSAKVLVKSYGLRSIAEGRALFETPTESGWQGEFPDRAIIVAYVGANVGCGFESMEPWEDQTLGCGGFPSPYGTLLPAPGQVPPLEGLCFQATPRACPEDKFTYIHGVLFAEVTDELDAQGRVITWIYPGHMVTSSLKLFMKHMTQRNFDVADTGYQLMRMRYQDSGLIPAFIGTGAQGPELETSVNLYLDTPYLSRDILDDKRLVAAAYHNQFSYPISMTLAGPVRFLSDGRMVVEQFNQEAVTVEMRGNSPMVWLDLMIPKEGTYLRYVSEPVKK